jgi:hypothetical protein
LNLVNRRSSIHLDGRKRVRRKTDDGNLKRKML